jgi:hypothetical protein
MGTRHLTCVVLDDTLRIAQFGRFDGYPRGAGFAVLDFLSSEAKPDFPERVRALTWATNADEATISTKWPNVPDEHGHLLGPHILREVNRRPVAPLRNSFDVGYNGALCDWAYVIDLDHHALDIYVGNPNSVPSEGLWAGGPGDKTFEHWHGGAHRIKTYPLDRLPTHQQFKADLDPFDDTTREPQ